MNNIKRKYMRFNNIYKRFRIAGLIILIAILSLPVSGQEKKEKKAKQLFDVVLKVVDANGTAISDANVVVGEGITHAVTDANGSVSLKGYADDVVTITAHGFEKSVSPVIDLLQNTTVTLSQAKLYMTSDDNVQLPFTALKKRNLSGPELVIDGSYFARYPSTDIRNALTGISSMIDVRELDGSPGMSPLEGLQQYSGLSNSYGSTDKFGGMPYVLIDGMPADLQEYIVDPSEIESVTLMKGILSNAMYGPAATGGVLYIKTKQGVKNERMLHVDLESGVSVVDRMPGYVSGAVYARMQNDAREASGLPAAYSTDAIGGYALNNGYDLKYPSTDFADMLLDKTMPFSRVNMSSSGGNEVVQYYSYLGYAHEGDIIDLGAQSDYNRITARQNVSVKITDMIKAQFGFYGNLSYRRSPNYGYDSDYTTEGTANSTLSLTELPSILTDIHNTPPIAYPIWAYSDTSTKPATPWYGVSSVYTSNIVGNILDNGYYTDKGRTGASNLALTFDFGKWVKGLKSTTYFAFNIHNTVRIGKNNDYLAYTIKDPDAVLLTNRVTKYSGHSLVKQTEDYKLMDYYFQRFMFYEQLGFNRTFGSNSIDLNAIYHQTISYINGIEEPQRQRSIVGTLMYSLMDKYAIQATVNYSGTSSFAKDYRNMLNWTVGGSWVLSDESFMSNINFFDYIKLRAQGGVVANETYFPNLYDVDRWSTSTGSIFGAYSSLTWFGSATESGPNCIYLSRTGNPELTFEKRREVNAGLDFAMLDNRLTLGVTYYNWLVDGSISQIQYNLPLLAGYAGARPYYNYNQTRYNAVGSDLGFTQKFGEVSLTVGGNATWVRGIRVKYDEPAYRNGYQERTGKISDAIFGYTYIGKFESDEAAQGETGLPLQLFDATLHESDLQYKDMNEDGFIDDIDQSVIGNSSPRLYYGLNIALKYKNFDLFILGAGRAFYDIPLTNAYFWNGWGDNNYSNFVHDNVGGDYPKLTYYKVNNNFVTSDFWLTKGGYFKIQNVELAYTIPAKMLKFMGSRGIRIYVRGANLLTFTKVKDVDPESINSGVTIYPLFRTFSGGIKFNF